MKKAIAKTLAVLAVIGGIILGAVGHGLLAFIVGVALAYIGALALLGKEEIINY